ncbi:MAG: glycosyltransferase [Pseudomonadota bacterium]
MHIAFYSSLVTDGHPTSGFEVANEAIVSRLRALGHWVSVIGFSIPRQREIRDPDAHVIDTVSMENADATVGTKAWWLARAILKRQPISSSKLTGTRRETLESLTERLGPFDAAIINSYQMAAAFPHLMDTPFGFIAHNVEHLSAAGNARSGTNSLSRYLYGRDARLLERLETDICRRADIVWGLSTDDLQTLGLEPTKGVFLPLAPPNAAEVLGKPNFVYDVGLIGTWTWEPNRVGLQWFLEQVVPQLEPGTKVAVAGTVPSEMMQGRHDVEFLGRVPSASEFLNSIRAVPLVSRGGTGVQLKTIEALQAGLACVATSSSLRGVSDLPDNCFRADETEDFARILKNMIAESRAGSLGRTDGAHFSTNQCLAMDSALRKGLERLA